MRVAPHFAALIFAITPVLAKGVILSGYESLDPTIVISSSVTASLDTIGVTQGSTSLKVTSAGEWNEPVLHNTGNLLNTIKSVYDTYGSAVLKLDFTAPAPAPAGWFQAQLLIQGDGLGQVISPLLWNTGAAAATPATLSWDISSIIAGSSISPPAAWGQIKLITNTSAPRVFYIDNLRVVPVLSGPQWVTDTGGDWHSAANWANGSAPNGVDAQATLGAAITSGRTVYADSDITLGSLSFNNTSAYNLSGLGTLNMEVSSGAAAIDVVQGHHKINLPLVYKSNTNVNAQPGSTLTIGDPSTIGSGKIVTTSGNVLIQAPLTIEAGGSLVIAAGSTSLFLSPSMGAGAAIDVKSNTLTIDYSGSASPAAAIKAQLTTGYNGGAWDGFGINTSAAASGKGLGWKDNAGTSSITVRFTYYGDTNLDAVVNFDDLLALAQAYGASGNWSSGDSDYNGTVNFDDLLKLAQNYGLSLSQGELNQLSDVAGLSFTQDWALATSLVPEPASLSLIALGTAALKRRRK